MCIINVAASEETKRRDHKQTGKDFECHCYDFVEDGRRENAGCTLQEFAPS